MTGLCGPIFTITLLIIFASAFLFSPRVSNVTVTPNVAYDENVFQDYADSQYRKEFSGTSGYEDNILLVFLTEDEEYYDYYYIAWVGDHIVTDVNYLFGNEQTELGEAIGNHVNASSYKYSLDSNLAQVVEAM